MYNHNTPHQVITRACPSG